jgi:hypothetical protein
MWSLFKNEEKSTFYNWSIIRAFVFESGNDYILTDVLK